MVLRKSGRVDSRRFRMRVQAKTTLDDESRFSFESAFFVSFSRGMYLINNNVLVVEFSNKIFIFATQI